MTTGGGSGARIRWFCEDEVFQAAIADQGLGTFEALTSRCLGESVTSHRSSWTRRCEIGGKSYFIKTYDYPSWRDRWRGFGRTTALARSRPEREAMALGWLREHGFQAPEVMAVGLARQLGVLGRACLMTRAWPGDRLDHVLPQLEPGERPGLATALLQLLTDLHVQGFRDRNMDLRNILGRRGTAGWILAKIDSPRHRIVRPGNRVDRLVLQDRQRLRRSLEELQLEELEPFLHRLD